MADSDLGSGAEPVRAERDSEGVWKDLTGSSDPWAPILMFGILIAMAVGTLFLHRLPFPALDYQQDMGAAATKLILALTVIAILMERALAVINGAWFGEETEIARGQLKAAMAANALLANQQRMGVTDKSMAGGAMAVSDAHKKLAEVEVGKKRLRLVIGFLFGIAISAVGIRTLAGLVKDPAHLSAAFNLVDIILTGALLAGGSQGMAKVAELLRTAIDGTSARMSART